MTKDGALLVLRHGSRELSLQPGEWFIGRDPDCLVRLDDPLISRRHAVLRVGDYGTTISDLSSSNGVYVNGEPVLGRAQLAAGDRILIGREEMHVLKSSDSKAPRSDEDDSLHRITRDRLRSMSLHPKEDAPSSGPAATAKVDTFALISTVVDRMLADRRVSDAERLLTPHIEALANDVNRGKHVPDEVAVRAAEYSIKLVEAGGASKWLDRVVHLYTGIRRTMPAAIASGFVRAAERASGFDTSALRNYVASMRTLPGHSNLESLGALERLEGLLGRGAG